MNRRQRNQLAMFRVLIQFFNRHKSKLDTIEILKKTIETFVKLVMNINEISLIQEGRTTGVTEMKLKEEEEMIQATIKVAAALFVYADTNNLYELKAKVNASESALRMMSNDALRIYCTNVYEEALKLVEELAPYGMPAETITQLKKEIDDFVEIIISPRSGIITRSQATAHLKELIDQANKMVRDNLDKLMLVAYNTYPELKNEYKSARVIVDLKGHGNGKNKKGTSDKPEDIN